MSSGVAAAEWIRRVADDERERDAVRASETARTARKNDLVERQARRLLDEVRTAVVRDAGAFREEFPGDGSRAVAVDVDRPAGGFMVHKPAPSAVSLTVTASADSASLMCVYNFTPTTNLPPREDRVHIIFVDDGKETLRMKHHGTGKTFSSCDDVSEFLLTPVLTGRPR